MIDYLNMYVDVCLCQIISFSHSPYNISRALFTHTSKCIYNKQYSIKIILLYWDRYITNANMWLFH